MGYPNGRYGVVLQSIMRDTSFSAEAKAIYAYLCTFADSNGVCYPNVSLMVHELRMSEPRFYKHFAELKRAGIVCVEQRKEHGRFAKNLYRVLLPKLEHRPNIL